MCGLYSITNKVGEIEANINKGLIEETAAKAEINALLGSVNNSQMLGLTLCMSVIPIILTIGYYILLKRKYIITEDLYEQMIKEIKEREDE